MHTGILESGERLARDRMALVDLLACLVLIAMKTLVGVSSNSLAVLAGAAASGLGFVFAILALAGFTARSMVIILHSLRWANP